ncbi:MAG TPA: hypothetical protein PL182_12695 [Pseudobdellovibrionaceae bacterium]|nr:hypothetical protein [Pseudobdellovibrionaceae bacterium]
MKTILTLALTLLSFPAFSATNLELAGDCKPTVERAISSLINAPTSVIAVEDIGPKTVIVTFNSYPQRSTLSRAQISFDNVRSLARGRMVYAIDCSISSLNFVR